MEYKNKNALVVGMAKSGIAAAVLLCKLGSNVTVYDAKKKKDFDKTQSGGRRPNQGGFNKNSRIPKALQKPAPQPKQEEKKPEVKEITLPEKMTIRELAEEP